MLIWLIALPHCCIFDYCFSYGKLHTDNLGVFMNKGIFLSLLHFAQVLPKLCVSADRWVHLQVSRCVVSVGGVGWVWWVERREEETVSSINKVSGASWIFVLLQVLLFKHWPQEKLCRMRGLLWDWTPWVTWGKLLQCLSYQLSPCVLVKSVELVFTAVVSEPSSLMNRYK